MESSSARNGLAWFLSMGLGMWGVLPAAAGKEAPTLPSLALAAQQTALAGPLRELLLHHLPTPLYEASPGWGRTVLVTTGLKWSGKGLHAHPAPVKEAKNDGTWKKVRITAENWPAGLVLELRNLQHPDPEHTTFEVFLAFDARVEYEQQKWQAGLRLYSGSVRARLRVQMLLQCELSSRLEWQGKLTPDAIFRLRVSHADLRYGNLVVEHLAGVGGDTAKLLGEALQRGLRRWHPSLERNLLTKANAAIEKAADTKEIRVGLSALLKK